MNRILPKIDIEAIAQNYGKFVIGPLESGFGITLGNALRRTLLSSLPGAAVTSVRVSGVHHEFSPIPNVQEDMTMFILNIKQLRLKLDGDGPVRLRLHVSGEGEITAGDLECPAEVEIINSELNLLTADSPDADLEIECVVERGRGYSPAEERGRLPIGDIPVDAIFSPIRKANYTVERMRVGQMTDFDRLIFEVWTDGTIAPQEALRQSAQILVHHFSLVAGVSETKIEPELVEPRAKVPSRTYDIPIEELGLSVRAYNCLKRAGITKVGEVLERLEKGEEEILSVRNFGRKSLEELKESLMTRGFWSHTGTLVATAPSPDQSFEKSEEAEDFEDETDEDEDEEFGEESWDDELLEEEADQ